MQGELRPIPSGQRLTARCVPTYFIPQKTFRGHMAQSLGRSIS
jgi:hypothetical protein